MLGYLEFTRSLLRQIQGRNQEVMEWAVNSVAVYKDILKMVKQAGQGNKSAEASERQTSLKAILRDYTKVFLQGFVTELPV